MKNNRSFTLIEMLVVIAILAGFMALLVPNFMLVRVKSRDVRRKSDLKNIQKALELYKQSRPLPEYPTALSALSSGTTKYMQSIPKDPVFGDYSYVAVVDPVNPAIYTSYTLCACLENASDPEQPTPPASCANITSCTGKLYNLTEPQ